MNVALADQRSPSEIVVEGAHAVKALIEAEDFSVTEVIVERDRHLDLAEQCRKEKITVRRETRAGMQQISGYDFHRGILASARRPQQLHLEPLLQEDCFRKFLILDHLADPGNLGTLIRSAAAFGADAVVLESGKGADPFCRKSIRSSATAVFRTAIIEVPCLEESLRQLQKSDVWLVGTSCDPEEQTQSAALRTPGSKIALAVGSEATGLRQNLSSLCSEIRHIAIADEMESLNAAVAGSLLMREVFAEG